MPDYKEKLKSKDSNASVICEHLAELCSQDESFRNEVESRKDRTVQVSKLGVSFMKMVSSISKIMGNSFVGYGNYLLGVGERLDEES
jgi:hypothetical protein